MTANLSGLSAFWLQWQQHSSYMNSSLYKNWMIILSTMVWDDPKSILWLNGTSDCLYQEVHVISVTNVLIWLPQNRAESEISLFSSLNFLLSLRFMWFWMRDFQYVLRHVVPTIYGRFLVLLPWFLFFFQLEKPCQHTNASL